MSGSVLRQVGRHRGTTPRLVALGLLALLVLGCGAVTPLTSSMGGSGSPTPPHEIATAIAWRESLGLRADEDYVRHLQADARAITTARQAGLEFPVTVAEAAELTARLERMLDVGGSIVEYGESHPEDWAGLVGSSRTGQVVAQFKDHLDVHRAALDRLLMPGAPYTLRQVRWSNAELRALAERIADDTAWLTSVDAKLSGYGVDELNNVALVDVLSSDPMVGERIVARYGAEGNLRVRVDGNLPWEGGWGEIEIRVLGADGTPGGAGLWCRISSDVQFTYPQAVPIMAGTCTTRVEATDLLVEITREDDDDAPVLGRGRVRAVEDALTVIQVRLDS